VICCWLPVAGDRATARSLCVQAVGCGLSGMAAQFSDESALEVCIHVMRYRNRRLYFFIALRGKKRQLGFASVGDFNV